MSKTGTCLCGAVKYTIDTSPKETGACHCTMCRKWSGGVYLAFEAKPEDVQFEGVENIAVFKSSEWAERAFCRRCGSSLYYRVTAPGPHEGTYHIGLGSLDDPSDIALTGELFIDRKPKGYSFAEKTHAMTEADVIAMFASDS